MRNKNSYSFFFMLKNRLIYYIITKRLGGIKLMSIKNIVVNFKKYSFLLQQLISRDFKVKYKRSVLGIVWSLLYPVLMMLVMAVVFSRMFKFSVPGVNYFVYFEVGFIMFNYFIVAIFNGICSCISKKF